MRHITQLDNWQTSSYVTKFVEECMQSQSGIKKPPKQPQVKQVRVGRLAESIPGWFIWAFLWPVRHERATAHCPTLIQ